MRLGGSAPHQVDVGVDQAGQERGVAEVYDIRAGGRRFRGRPDGGYEIPLDHDRAVLDGPGPTVKDAGCPIRCRYLPPLLLSVIERPPGCFERDPVVLRKLLGYSHYATLGAVNLWPRVERSLLLPKRKRTAHALPMRG